MNRNKIAVTAALMVGLLVAALDQTIVDTAFPRMIAELRGESIFTWVITAYMLASTAIIPVVGKLADIYGRKIFYLTGLGLFVGGSMLCGAAQGMGQLIAFRSLQGIGGGMLMPITLTIVGDLFPGEQRAKMQGLFGAVYGLASVIGPKLGGWITHHYTWRWIFYINLPIGIAAALMMFFFYRESRGERRPIDWWGAVTVTAGILLFLLAIARGGKAWDWDSWQSLSLFGGGAVLLALFAYIEMKVPEPVLDPSLFRNRVFAVMSSIGLLMGAGMFGAIVFIPWFIQGVAGANPNEAGNVMTPMMLAMVVSSIIAGRLALKLTYRWQVTMGFLITAAGFLLMTRWSVQTTPWTATLNSMVVGVGLGQIMPLLTLAVQNAFPASRRGVVTSATTFFRQIGASIGVTVFGVIFNNQMARQFELKMASVMERVGPALGQLPAEGQRFFQRVAEDPQALVHILLSEEAQAALPEVVRGPFIETVKLMMAESLHVVFWSSLVLVAAAILVAQLLGRANLKQQARELGEEASLRAPVAAD